MVENKVYLKEDIIEEVCQKLGKDKEIVEAIFNNTINRMKDMIENDPEVLSIKIPMLGNLKVMYHLARYNKNKVSKRRIEILTENYNNSYFFSPTLMEKFFKNHRKGKRKDTFVKFYKYLRELESINNESVKKYFK